MPLAQSSSRPRAPPDPHGNCGRTQQGVSKAVIIGGVASDRYAFSTELFKNFFNTDVFLGQAYQRAGRASELECCR